MTGAEYLRPGRWSWGPLGTCTGINAVSLLKKCRQLYASSAVEVEGLQQVDWPHALIPHPTTEAPVAVRPSERP